MGLFSKISAAASGVVRSIPPVVYNPVAQVRAVAHPAQTIAAVKASPVVANIAQTVRSPAAQFATAKNQIKHLTIKSAIKYSTARVLPPKYQHKLAAFVDHAADKYGERKACANKASVTLGLGLASAGTVAGPYGTAIGAVVGVVAGQAKGLSSPCNPVTVIGDNPNPAVYTDSTQASSVGSTSQLPAPGPARSFFDDFLDELFGLFGEKRA